ncbi:hypothetical protein LEP1GSC195_0930 [Leptospira wolbachii serovar Codice str. CDC]|uniref:Uncharacterized protein n=1 Tax=Leptospira wolbachii serovar Codice str. CDC TaxID=1218599 RepID=R8ZYL9_9LEPT|nr:hypothetical protein [Leptospira wolbachii]EOQ94824.1 hypothetical protein LEP1GSC195_0930 [Leptospira wolbachii serovar Codice str. CDC]
MYYIKLDPFTIYEKIGKTDSFVTIDLDPSSEDFKKYNSPLSGILHYTLNQRKYFAGEDIALGIKENISFLKLNTLDLNYKPEIKTLLITEGLSIQSIIQIILTPNDNIQNDIPKNHKNKITIPIEFGNDPLEMEKMTLILYKKYIESGIKLLKSEKEKFVGIYMGMFGNFPETILSNIELQEAELVENFQIHRHYLNTKRKKGLITETEESKLKKSEAKHFWKQILLLVKELKKLNIRKKEISEIREILNIILPAMFLIEDDRMVQESPTIYWNNESFLHIVLRHLYNHKIKKVNKSEIPYKLEDLEILVRRIVSVIYFEWKHFNQKNQNKKFSKYGAESVYYNGNYYVIHIAPDGRIESLYNTE